MNSIFVFNVSKDLQQDAYYLHVLLKTKDFSEYELVVNDNVAWRKVLVNKFVK